MPVLTAKNTSYEIARCLIDKGINPFTGDKSQKEHYPNHYQLELEADNGKIFTLYFCDYDKKGINSVNSYSRLEITVEEGKGDKKTHRKFVELGLAGIVTMHSGIGNRNNIQSIYEKEKEEILELLIAKGSYQANQKFYFLILNLAFQFHVYFLVIQ